MESFKEILLELDDITGIQRLELFDENGKSAGTIINQPGSAGSVKVFNHLYQSFGSINVDAAVEGLSLYAEHTEDAENNPGKHPNIDRLFKVVEDEAPLTVKVFKD